MLELRGWTNYRSLIQDIENVFWSGSSGPLFLLLGTPLTKMNAAHSAAGGAIANENAVTAAGEPRLVREAGLEARIAAIVEPALIDMGFRLVRVRISGRDGMTVQIMAEQASAEGEGAITVENCADISRDLSVILDVADPIEHAYHLEISSPGIDRPLVRASDFSRWAGHDVKIETHEMIDGRRRFKGILKGIDGDAAIIAWTPHEGGAEEIRLPLPGIADARLIMTDALLEASLRETKKAMKAARKKERRQPRDRETAMAKKKEKE